MAKKYPLAMTEGSKKAVRSRPKKASLKKMKPAAFLEKSRPLQIGEGDRAIINEFKKQIESGDPMGPLKLYGDGSEDGRHRAKAAQELGLGSVPVVDYRDGRAGGGPVMNVPTRLPIGGDTEAFFRRLALYSYAVAPLMPGRHGYAAGGDPEVEGSVSAAPDGVEAALNVARRVQLPPMDIAGAPPAATSRATLPPMDIGRPQPEWGSASDVVRHRLDTGEKQLPQYDREAVEAWKEGAKSLGHVAAYGVPVVGPALGAYDLAMAAKEIASPEFREGVRKGDYLSTGAGLTSAALAALGAPGKAAKAAAAAGAVMMPEEARATMFGEAAKMSPQIRSALEAAKRALVSGAKPSETWMEHGWAPDPSGKMVGEISDAPARFIPEGLEKFRRGEGVSLGEILSHPELYERYPSSFTTRVNPFMRDVKERGEYNPIQDAIGSNIRLSDRDLLENLLHEHQHRVQHIERMSPGTSPDVFKGPEYHAEPLMDDIKSMQGAALLQEFINKDPSLSAFDAFERAQKAGLPIGPQPLKFIRMPYEDLKAGASDLQSKVDEIYATVPPAYEQYRRSLGEWSARMPGERLDLTGPQRRWTYPYVENYPAIVRPPSSTVIENVRSPKWMRERDAALDLARKLQQEPLPKRDSGGVVKALKTLGKLFPEGSGYKSVPGKPAVVALPEFGRVEARPVPEIERAASGYMQSIGRPGEHEVSSFAPFNPAFATKVGEAFERMKHDPADPAVRRAYDALIDETMAQYRAAKDTGIDFRFLKPGEADPYAASPALGYEDIVNRGRLVMFPTEQGFGSTGGLPADNPLLRRAGRVGDKENAVVNDAFRIVHDLYGHFGAGNPFFRAPGEERAFQLHSKMFSPEALPAATAETRGQNSWLNYGPYGERNRSALGADTVFAEQKIGRMPEWASAPVPDRDKDVDEYVRSLIGRAEGGGVDGYADGGSIKKALDIARGIIAYHGSPHSFDKFDISKIGTGEGAQAYGHGLYFADNEGVARSYRDALSHDKSGLYFKEVAIPEDISTLERIRNQHGAGSVEELMRNLGRDRDYAISQAQGAYEKHIHDPARAETAANYFQSHALDSQNKIDFLINNSHRLEPYRGHMYQVRINADPEHFLDWDKPLSEQSPVVQRALQQAGWSPEHMKSSVLDGGYVAPTTPYGSSKYAEAGIPGIKYLDQGSRGAGEGSRNYVVFDDKLLDILKRYAKGGDVEGYAGGGRLTGDSLKAALEMAEKFIAPTRRTVAPDESLLAMHQISPVMLPKIRDLGALPAPSIGIGKVEHDPLDFGAITLIGRPHMAIPSETNPIFGQDVWSPRVPPLYPLTPDQIAEFGGAKHVLSTKEGFIPATPENIVAQMKKRPIIGGEYLTGKHDEADPELGYVISSLTPKFGSFEEMSAARDRLLPRTRANDQYVALHAEHENLANALDRSRFNPGAGDDDPVQRLGRAILFEDQHKGSNFYDAFKTFYPGASDPQKEWFRQHVESIRNLPTSYFEAKPQRVVDFGEFGGAVVPQQKWNEVSPLLKQMGINKIMSYDQFGATMSPPGYTHSEAIRDFPELSFKSGGAPEDDVGEKKQKDIVSRALDFVSQFSPVSEAQAETLPAGVIKQLASKVIPTVKNLAREEPLFPGVYGNPREMAAEAASRVPAEDPMLKRLWGLNREDIYTLGAHRPGNAPGQIAPGPATSRGLNYAAEGIMTPENERRLIDILEEGKKQPNLRRGMMPWYYMDPVYNRLEQLFGPEEAAARYKIYNVSTGALSPGSDVLTEMNRGLGAYHLGMQGRIGDFIAHGGNPQAAPEGGLPEYMRDVMRGHAYHSTSQGKPLQKFYETGEYTTESPKVPLYIQASGVPQTGFQTDLPVPDAHYTRILGMPDVRKTDKMKEAQKSMTMGEYRPTGPWFRENVARPAEMEAVPAQALLWGTGSGATGVDTPIGVPKLEILSQEIGKMAARHRISPETARDLFLSGTLYAHGGSVIQDALDVSSRVSRERESEAA